jgi:hypothetical protein
MTPDTNPIIQPENYFQGYEESAAKLKNDPKILEFDKLCYELFEHQEAGKKFIELITDRYLLAPTGSPGSPTFQNEAMWGEGLRYAFLLLRNAVRSHKQRILAQGKQNG